MEEYEVYGWIRNTYKRGRYTSPPQKNKLTKGNGEYKMTCKMIVNKRTFDNSG